MKLMQKKNFKKFVGSDDKSGVALPNFIKLSKILGFETFEIRSEYEAQKKINKINRIKPIRFLRR